MRVRLHESNIFNTRVRAEYELTGKMFLQGEFDSPPTSIPITLVTTLFRAAFTFITIGCQSCRSGIGGTFGYNWVDDPDSEPDFRADELAPQL